MAFFLLAGLVNMLAALLAVAGTLYYVVLYSLLLKECDSPEHCHRRRRGCDPASGGVGGRDRRPDSGRDDAVYRHLFLDPSSFLGISPGQAEGLCTGRCAHVTRCPGRKGNSLADFRIYSGARGDHALTPFLRARPGGNISRRGGSSWNLVDLNSCPSVAWIRE